VILGGGPQPYAVAADVAVTYLEIVALNGKAHVTPLALARSAGQPARYFCLLASWQLTRKTLCERTFSNSQLQLTVRPPAAASVHARRAAHAQALAYLLAPHGRGRPDETQVRKRASSTAGIARLVPAVRMTLASPLYSRSFEHPEFVAVADLAPQLQRFRGPGCLTGAGGAGEL